jgi:LysR family glycine cleavage system transcriptional activator
MAVEGAGVAIGDNLTGADFLLEGQLVRPFEPVLALETAFHLLTPSRKSNFPATRAFRDWLIDMLSSVPPTM